MTSEEWLTAFESLESYQQTNLERGWSDLKDAINSREYDWLRPRDVKEYLSERGASDGRLKNAAGAVRAFPEVYNVPTSAGDSIAAYEIWDEDLDEFERELGLG